MRTFIAALLMIALSFQFGCAISPKMMARKDRKPDQKAAERFLAARRLEGQNKFELARERYVELLKQYPNHTEYLHRLGVVCTQLQRFGEAESYYERAYERDPKNAELLTDMGYTNHIRGDQVKAERLLRESLHLKPSNARTTANLALVVGVRGKTDESLKLLREVGDEASALTGLAYIHTRRDELDLAEQRYNDALAINPKYADAQKGLAKLQQRRQRDELQIAKLAAEKEKADALASGKKPDDIQQVAAINSKESNGVSTADFSEEWADDDEPRELSEVDDVAQGRLIDADSMKSVDMGLHEDDFTAEEPAELDDSTESKKPASEESSTKKVIKMKTRKISSSVLQANFESADADCEACSTKRNRRPASAPSVRNAKIEPPANAGPLNSDAESDDFPDM